MRIEFKKVQTFEKDFLIHSNSIDFSGTFCRISSNLIQLHATLEGELLVDCCKCGETYAISLCEKQKFIVSDGPFLNQDEKEEEIVLEVDDHYIDFDDIVNSELESIRSDYHICQNCTTNNKFVDVEF